MDQGIVVWRFSETLNAYFQHDVGEKDTKGDGESIRRLLNNLLPWVFEVCVFRVLVLVYFVSSVSDSLSPTYRHPCHSFIHNYNVLSS